MWFFFNRKVIKSGQDDKSLRRKAKEIAKNAIRYAVNGCDAFMGKVYEGNINSTKYKLLVNRFKNVIMLGNILKEKQNASIQEWITTELAWFMRSHFKNDPDLFLGSIPISATEISRNKLSVGFTTKEIIDVFFENAKQTMENMRSNLAHINASQSLYPILPGLRAEGIYGIPAYEPNVPSAMSSQAPSCPPLDNPVVASGNAKKEEKKPTPIPPKKPEKIIHFSLSCKNSNGLNAGEKNNYSSDSEDDVARPLVNKSRTPTPC